MIKVSILIPVYKVECYIKRCLISLFSQDYQNLEFIFVDDGSPDKSVEIINDTVRDYPNRANQIKIIHHPINLGSGASRLSALEAATGDYVMWVDSDDWMEPDVISLFVNKAINENSDIVIANHFHTFPNERIEKNIGLIKNKALFIKQLITRENAMPVCLWNKLIRRELHLKVKPEKGLNYGEDFCILPRLVYFSNTISQISQYTYNYWQGNPNSYIKNFSQGSYDNIIKSTEILYDFFHKYPDAVSIKSLQTMRLRTKLLLIGKGDKNQKKQALKIWPDLKITDDLSVIENLTLKLASVGAFGLINFILKNGVRTKSLFKKLKTAQ